MDLKIKLVGDDWRYYIDGNLISSLMTKPIDFRVIDFRDCSPYVVIEILSTPYDLSIDIINMENYSFAGWQDFTVKDFYSISDIENKTLKSQSLFGDLEDLSFLRHIKVEGLW